MTTRTMALAYLPTVGTWSLVRAIRFYSIPANRKAAA